VTDLAEAHLLISFGIAAAGDVEVEALVAGSQHGQGAILDGDAAKAWLDKYCRENPTNTFAKASDELYLFVRSIGQ